MRFEVVCDELPRDVILVSPGVRTLDVVQVIRQVTGLSLWHSRELVGQAPVVVLGGVPEEVAEGAIAALRVAGAQAVMRPQA